MHLKPKLKRVGNKVAHPTLAPQGETVKYTSQERQIIAKLLLDHSSSVGKFSTIEAAGTYIQNVLSNDIGLGEIEAGATINFAGHSLGGHLLH